MEFEEMQIIWNEQNNERLFAINEDALYKHIKRKGRSVEHILGFFEWGMILINLLVGIVLIIDSIQDGGPTSQYVVSAMYLAYSLYAVFRRLRRRKEEVHFEPTMLGELNKALWQMDYLIRQAKSIALWYMLPLTLVLSANFFLTGKSVWAWLLLLIMLPISIFGPRWEINKWYLPKKRELEAIKETLLGA